MNVFSKMIHYNEHLLIHRLIKPGDILKITGEIIAIAPHKKGTYLVGCLKAFDKKVFVEHSGVLLLGTKTTGDVKGLENAPVSPKLSKKEHPYIYDGCSDIIFPIHTSKPIAKFVGLPDIILQGTATLGIAIREIVNREAYGDPNRIREISAKFSSIVLPENSIQIQINKFEERKNEKDVYFSVLNHNKKVAIKYGFVRIGNNLKT